MSPTDTPMAGVTAVLLARCGAHDEAALRDLHRLAAPCLLALARYDALRDPEQAVEDVFVLVWRHGACHARSSLPAPDWLLHLARRHFRTCLAGA